MSKKERQFPLIMQHKERLRPTVPWWVAEKAYETYSRWYGNSQSLERIAARGGFGMLELIWLLDGTDKHFEQWVKGPVKPPEIAGK